LNMFINEYTIMNYETTNHRSRESQEDQQGDEATQENQIESGHRTFGGGMRDIAATGVSLCARGGEVVEGATNSRRERSGDCKITCEYNQRSPAIKQENKREYQWDYNRSDKGLSKTTWRKKEDIDKWSFSMSLTG
jgi:hypothetical protein